MGANKRELIPIHRFSYKIKKTQKSKRQGRPITQVQTSKACESGCMSVIMVVQFFFSFFEKMRGQCMVLLPGSDFQRVVAR